MRIETLLGQGRDETGILLSYLNRKTGREPGRSSASWGDCLGGDLIGFERELDSIALAGG